MPADLPPDAALLRLLATMAQAAGPGWRLPLGPGADFATIAPYTIEEAYEVADAIARDDLAAICWTSSAICCSRSSTTRRWPRRRGFSPSPMWRELSPTNGPPPPACLRRRRRPATRPRCGLGGPEGADGRPGRSRHARRRPGCLPALTRAAEAHPPRRPGRLRLARRRERCSTRWRRRWAELRAELPPRPPGPAGGRGWRHAVRRWPTWPASSISTPRRACAAPTPSSSGASTGVEARLATRGLAPGDAGWTAMEAEWQAVKRAELARADQRCEAIYMPRKTA